MRWLARAILLIKPSEGPGAAAYAFFLGLIVLACLATIHLVGSQLTTTVASMGNSATP